MTAIPIIIDCDPGQDDAINLFLAMSAPAELDIRGITTVAGNVPLELTTRNARLICDIGDRGDIPVFAGCNAPLRRALLTAENVHGKSGIAGIEIVEPRHRARAQSAVDFIIQTLRASADHSITLVATGPLTNIATALKTDPEIAAKVERIVMMGGARREAGNASPSAEFNILVDPHAADIVFRCGRPITMIGLDATHQVLATAARQNKIGAIDNGAARATAAMLEHYDRINVAKFGADGAPLHDPCTVAFLLQPKLFEAKTCSVAVEIQSELSMGHTSVDFWGVTEREPNADWVHTVDADGFFDLLVERLEHIG